MQNFGKRMCFWQCLQILVRTCWTNQERTWRNTYFGSVYPPRKYVLRVCLESPFTRIISTRNTNLPPPPLDRFNSALVRKCKLWRSMKDIAISDSASDLNMRADGFAQSSWKIHIFGLITKHGSKLYPTLRTDMISLHILCWNICHIFSLWENLCGGTIDEV